MLEMIGTTLLGFIVLLAILAITGYILRNSEKVLRIMIYTLGFLSILLFSYATGYVILHSK